jgi:hypothetical protein
MKLVTMNDILEQRRQELLSYHRANGCINIRKLANKSRILIKTSDEVYEFEVGTAKRGVVLIASNVRFQHRDKVVVTGSIDPETNIFMSVIIGEGLKIILRSRRGHIIRTEPVNYAKVTGVNYEFELWGD